MVSQEKAPEPCAFAKIIDALSIEVSRAQEKADRINDSMRHLRSEDEPKKGMEKPPLADPSPHIINKLWYEIERIRELNDLLESMKNTALDTIG